MAESGTVTAMRLTRWVAKEKSFTDDHAASNLETLLLGGISPITPPPKLTKKYQFLVSESVVSHNSQICHVGRVCLNSIAGSTLK